MAAAAPTPKKAGKQKTPPQHSTTATSKSKSKRKDKTSTHTISPHMADSDISDEE